MNEIVENSVHTDFDVNITIHSFAHLKELGTERGYVTYDDILRLFPETELNIDYQEQIYEAICNAGITVIEDSSLNDAPSKSPADDDADETSDSRARFREDNLLTNVDPDNLIGLYFCEATRQPLLTFDEEVALAKRIEQGLLARDEISKIKYNSAKRHEELLHLVEDSWSAVNHLITANSRLVISIPKKYTHQGVPFLDLIQEGNIGLIRAAKKFDYKRGYKFSTYATWWIRQAVSRALAGQSRTIRLPVHRIEQLSEMFRKQHQLRQLFGRDPDVAEIAEAMGLSTEKILQMSKDAQYPLSLDMPISFEDDSVLGDFIEDQESPDPDEIATLSLLGQHLDQILEMLPPREAKILKLRFGLSNGKIHSLQEIGIKIGVSRERIRQIEGQAINRLRQPEIQLQLRSYLGQIQT